MNPLSNLERKIRQIRHPESDAWYLIAAFMPADL